MTVVKSQTQCNSFSHFLQEIIEDNVALCQVIKFKEKESADLERSVSELTSDGFNERSFVHVVPERMSVCVRVDKALLRSRVSVRTMFGAGAGESHGCN